MYVGTIRSNMKIYIMVIVKNYVTDLLDTSMGYTYIRYPPYYTGYTVYCFSMNLYNHLNLCGLLSYQTLSLYYFVTTID